MLKKLTEDIYNSILKYNRLETVDAIPHSDQFEKEINSMFLVEPHVINQVLNILKESHKILSIEVVKEDPDNDIKKVEGFVDADLTTVRRLKILYQNALMDEYESQHHNRLLVHQIVKEVYSRISLFKNNTLGHLANKAIMLEEFENLIEKNFEVYNDSYKSKVLHELFEKTENILTEKEELLTSKKIDDAKKTAADTQRAIDSEKYKSASTPVSKDTINKTLQIYGVNFFFRVNLRKYNFLMLKEAVENGIIDKKTDLKQLKSMMVKIKSNYSKDPELEKHLNEINALDHTVSKYMLLSRK